MTLPLFAETRASPVVLLDLNHTLAENSAERFAFAGQYAAWIAEHERYRRWLVELLRERTVVLVTARHVRYEVATLERIAEACDGWKPDECHFRDTDEAPPAFKARTYAEVIAPRRGVDPTGYLGLESNAATRRAYGRLGIRSVRVPDECPSLGGSLLELVEQWAAGP